MNLSTARSSKRSAEVGVRKVLGAEKQSLIRQFLGESVMMALIALVFAVIITQLLLPLFAQISDKNLSLPAESASNAICSVFCPCIDYRTTGRELSGFLSFFISACKSVERKAFEFTSSCFASENAGCISVRSFQWC